MRGLLTKLAETLEAAHEHLEWCGYGDSYESECARSQKLPERLESAIGSLDELQRELRKREEMVLRLIMAAGGAIEVPHCVMQENASHGVVEVEERMERGSYIYRARWK